MTDDFHRQFAILLQMEASLQIALLCHPTVPAEWTDCLRLLTKVRDTIAQHAALIFDPEGLLGVQRQIMDQRLSEYQAP